jgi:hypothetical protein
LRAALDRHVKGLDAPLLDHATANQAEVELIRHTIRGE